MYIYMYKSKLTKTRCPNLFENVCLIGLSFIYIYIIYIYIYIYMYMYMYIYIYVYIYIYIYIYILFHLFHIIPILTKMFIWRLHLHGQ